MKKPRFASVAIPSVAAATILLLFSNISFGADFSGVAPLPGGLALQVMDRAVSCNGGPGAFVFRDGQKIDQTCNVKITRKGVSVLFAGYGKRIFFPKEQFTALIPQP